MALFADVLKELKKPFDPKDVEWRIQKKSKDGTKGMAMAYIDARAIANRLDEVVDRNMIDGWSVDYRPIDMGTVKRQRRGFDTEEPIKGLSVQLHSIVVVRSTPEKMVQISQTLKHLRAVCLVRLRELHQRGVLVDTCMTCLQRGHRLITGAM